MSPAERRDAIIAATIPLVREHGLEVSTRQIADAAGIAEGTIFRVFPDKDSLLQRVIEAALDPDGLEARIGAVDSALPLRVRLRQATGILQRHLESVIQLASMIGPNRLPQEPTAIHEHRERVTAMLKALFEPDRDQLRCSTDECARLLQLVTFGVAHPRLKHGLSMTPDEVVSFVLDGVRRRSEDDPSP